MKYGTWTISSYEESAAGALRAAGWSPVTAAVLCSRGYDTPEKAQEFLSADVPLSSPMDLLDMDKAVRRVRKALERREHICVFGDYDVDGITATCLLTDFLRKRGAHVTSYIPARLEEGYGLNEIAVRALRAQDVKLIITVDCGITANQEAALCKELGMELVITDHHECKSDLPEAVAVVDPHRKDQPEPVLEMAGVGVAFKLAAALAGDQEALLAEYCDLLCLGTVADVMPLTGENRKMVWRGLQALSNPKRVGLAALMAECGALRPPITAGTIGYTLAPRINAAGRMGHVEIATELFLTNDAARAVDLASQLCKLNRKRQDVESGIYKQAVSMLPAGKSPKAIVLADETWHQGVVGIVASRLAEEYSCPTFLICLDGDKGKASSRSYGGFNLFASLEQCSDLLDGFGGHELAAGFTIPEENIDTFRQRMNRFVKAASGGERAVSCLEVDAAISNPADMTLEQVDHLAQLEPYGSGNPRPVFALLGATVDSVQAVGQGKHLKLRLSKGPSRFDAIFFSMPEAAAQLEPGCRVDAAFYLQANTFRGTTTLQLQLVDLRPSLTPSRHEAESLDLLHRLTGEQPLTAQETARLMISRDQFAAFWRILDRHLKQGKLETDLLPYLRSLAVQVGGCDSFLRAALALTVFQERGLISLSRQEDRVTLCLNPIQGKVDLYASPCLRRLRGGAEVKRGDSQ